MAFTWRFFTFLACVSVTALSDCKADKASLYNLPSPTQLSHKWLDPFTVNVSWHWERPSNLSENCCVTFSVGRLGQDINNHGQTTWTYFVDSHLTEEDNTDRWNYTIHTRSCDGRHTTWCDGWKDSEPVVTTVSTPKRRAKLVKDFECLLDREGMNCSWTPKTKTLNLTLSYRRCGHNEDVRKTIETFYPQYRSEQKDGSYLKRVVSTPPCISAASETHLTTFKSSLVVPSPKLTITQNHGYLQLHWTLPEVGKCDWKYTWCYKECGVDKGCSSITVTKGEKPEVRLPYDERCLYELLYNVTSSKYSTKVFSHHNTATYGSNKVPDQTQTVVAIVLPLFLSVCVILSCCCFRRHRHIICPVIPDPSVIFKEMLQKGNKEPKPMTERVFSPREEEVAKVCLMDPNSSPEQNS